MEDELVVEGRSYRSATHVGRSFGYTKDYILLLIKQGKIDGQKVGHKWYAEPESAAAFFSAAKIAREKRKQEISRERKAELKAHTKTRTLASPKAALIETLVIVIIGLSIGATGYLGTSTNVAATSTGGDSFLEHLARSLYDFISPRDTKVVIETRTPPGERAIAANIGTTTHTSLIVAPDELFTSTTIETIRDSFSDEVHVSLDPLNPDTGIIIPQFRTRDGEPFRFLMVPVKTATP